MCTFVPTLAVPPAIPGKQTKSLQTPGQAFLNTLRNGMNYAFINIWWAWIWFPFMRATFHAFGAALDVATLLSIGTFLSVCSWLGHRRTVADSQPQPVGPSP